MTRVLACGSRKTHWQEISREEELAIKKKKRHQSKDRRGRRRDDG